MADGDYERGRAQELAQMKAHVRALRSHRIIVLNGWASSSHAWDLCSFLSHGARLYSDTEILQGEVEKLFSCSSPVRPNQMVLVGWSMGGTKALEIATKFPSRVAGLVLVAATPRMMEERETHWQGMRPRRLEAFLKGASCLQGESFFPLPEGKPNPYRCESPDALAEGLSYLRQTDVRAQLEAQAHTFHFPVYIFQSARDGIVCAENARYLKTIFPHAHVQILPLAEHALPIFIPKEIDEAVDACLAVATSRAHLA